MNEQDDQLKPMENEPPDDDDYHGGEGWFVVAVGECGRACYLAIDPGFGALRFWINESGLDDPSDADLLPDGDEGIFRATARAWTSRSYEGEHDMGFTVTTPWEEVTTRCFSCNGKPGPWDGAVCVGCGVVTSRGPHGTTVTRPGAS